MCTAMSLLSVRQPPGAANPAAGDTSAQAPPFHQYNASPLLAPRWVRVSALKLLADGHGHGEAGTGTAEGIGGAGLGVVAILRRRDNMSLTGLFVRVQRGGIATVSSA